MASILAATTTNFSRGIFLNGAVRPLLSIGQLAESWADVFADTSWNEAEPAACVVGAQACGEKPIVALNRIHDATAVMCIGSFNPAIFHPAWLSSRNLIQKTEEVGAEVQAVTPDATAFRIKWLQLQVLRDRFTAATETPDDSLLLRDLVVGAFRFLEHTPVSFVGLNRHIHFQIQSEKEWQHIGHVLAPGKIWDRYLRNSGLSALTIKAQPADKSRGEINVQVNASHTRPNVIEIAVNNHFALEAGSAASAAAELIGDRWDEAMRSASELAESIVTDALKEPAGDR
jgi:hypothetical protein